MNRHSPQTHTHTHTQYKVRIFLRQFIVGGTIPYDLSTMCTVMPYAYVITPITFRLFWFGLLWINFLSSTLISGRVCVHFFKRPKALLSSPLNYMWMKIAKVDNLQGNSYLYACISKIQVSICAMCTCGIRLPFPSFPFLSPSHSSKYYTHKFPWFCKVFLVCFEICCLI